MSSWQDDDNMYLVSEYGPGEYITLTDGQKVMVHNCGNCGSDNAYEGPDGNFYCWCLEED